MQKSTKSDCASKPRAKWRLRRTLSRKPWFRPIEDADVGYLWVAYKKGKLASLGEDFEGTDMGAAAFKERFEQEIVTNYDGAWMQFVPGIDKPVGLVLGFWPHKNHEITPYMVVGDMIWFPWTSARNKIETAVNFFNEARAETPFVEYASMEDKPFFETIAKHGIMRRVGTSHSIYAGKPACVFETRAK